MTLATSSAICSMEYGAGGLSERPVPRLSMTTARATRPTASLCGRHAHAAYPSPWTNTTGVPLRSSSTCSEMPSVAVTYA